MATLRPDEYRGFICIDHRTAGKSITELLSKHIPIGYTLAAVRIYISNLTNTQKLLDYPIDVLLSGKLGYKKAEIRLSLADLLLSVTALQIDFTINDNDSGNIDWKDVDEIDTKE
jgi:hypothetical protein